MADNERSASRSQSRRRRRQNQRQRQAPPSKADMTSVQEADGEEEADEEVPRSGGKEMQPFERIGESMDGPVTYARQQREMQAKGQGNQQPQQQPQKSKDMMDQDGLKLRIELNLDIEIELKASIHGDLTLAIRN